MKKYLIAVDDEKDLQFLFDHFFEKQIKAGELEVIFKTSGVECIDTIKDLDGDIVVLSDINMPEMNGIDLLKNLSSTYPSVKVLLVSAYDEKKYREDMDKYGAKGYVSKPVDFDVLKNRVFDLLDITH